MSALLEAYCGESGQSIVRMDRETMLDCSAQGACDEAVSASVDIVEWLADRPALERFLEGYGAWPDLSTCGEVTLRERALWVAACNLRDDEREAEKAVQA